MDLQSRLFGHSNFGTLKKSQNPELGTKKAVFKSKMLWMYKYIHIYIYIYIYLYEYRHWGIFRQALGDPCTPTLICRVHQCLRALYPLMPVKKFVFLQFVGFTSSPKACYSTFFSYWSLSLAKNICLNFACIFSGQTFGSIHKMACRKIIKIFFLLFFKVSIILIIWGSCVSISRFYYKWKWLFHQYRPIKYTLFLQTSGSPKLGVGVHEH